MARSVIYDATKNPVQGVDPEFINPTINFQGNANDYNSKLYTHTKGYFFDSGSLGKFVALLGDPSNHGGVLITHNQDGTLTVNGLAVAVDHSLHACPITGHGVTPVNAITIRSFHNNRLILTAGAVAGCGALLTPPNRFIFVE